MTHSEIPKRKDFYCEFSAPGWLVTHPVAPILAILIGSAVFGWLAIQVKTNGPWLRSDILLAAQFHAMAAQATPAIIEIMTFGFFLGKEMVEIIGVILVVYFLHKRFWPELGMVLIGWSGGALLWIFITQYFHRARPDAQIGIVVHEPSFPSGHTMQSILCFGLLAYFLVPRMPSLFWKWVVVITAIATALFIGYSRLYEGGHYPIDLIAGYALGIAWGALIYTVMEIFVVRRRV
ncbi:MAG TPA: phosphatase PAP2 family protein [Anaerolineales bacterium]|nr:phosphatase PAP2 family protein [Anaerolineales bacterium]